MDNIRRRMLEGESLKYINNGLRSQYFIIEALENGLTAKLSVNSCLYRVDNGNWTSLSANTNTVAINIGLTLSFKGDLIPDSTNGIGTFTISKKCNLKGNIMSLLYGDNFVGQTNLTGKSYSFFNLFQNCNNIINAEELILPAIILSAGCYRNMFLNCTSLITIPQLHAMNLAEHCYRALFYNCSKLTTAPVLPATLMAPYCYYYMFSLCTQLKEVPQLHAMNLAEHCYRGMFSDCKSLTKAPELPATTLAHSCYRNMFMGCDNLKVTPELPATTLEPECYAYMFYTNNGYKSPINYIKMLATDISASDCLLNWVSNVSSTGTFVKHASMNSLPRGTSGIPSGWVVEDNFNPIECISLSITAEDVSGRNTTTNITYTAVIKGYLDENNITTITKTGTVVSDEFPQNTSETETVTRTISYTYMGVTATTTITLGIWTNSAYTINLNDNWRLSTKVNPDSTIYDGVYESYSNYNVHNSVATMYIDISGYDNFKLYIRSYAESNYDYVMVSLLDKNITGSTSYSDTTLVKGHTRGNQQSSTAIEKYTLIEYTNIAGGNHRITIVYRKDSSANSGDDRGYVLIPKNQ